MKNRSTLAITILVAATGAVFAIGVAARSPRTAAPSVTTADPAVTGVYGIGLVEPLEEITRVAPASAGVVETVSVALGQRVAVGDVLVVLDEREARARLATEVAAAASTAAAVRQCRAELVVAQARQARISSPPRAEDAAPLTEAVRVASAEAAEARERLARYQKLARGVVPAADLVERQHQAEAGDARAAQAKAEAARAAAPGWERDVAVATAETDAATEALAVSEAAAVASTATVEVARVALAQRTVHAPRAGTVLRINVHAGEWVTPAGAALLEIGDVSHLRLVAEIDALDAWRDNGADAVAWRRGDPARTFAARHLRVEPLARAKNESSGAPGEIVDTRVRRILFSLDAESGLLPGEQLEVRLRASPAGADEVRTASK